MLPQTASIACLFTHSLPFTPVDECRMQLNTIQYPLQLHEAIPEVTIVPRKELARNWCPRPLWGHSLRIQLPHSKEDMFFMENVRIREMTCKSRCVQLASWISIDQWHFVSNMLQHLFIFLDLKGAMLPVLSSL